MFLKTGPLMNFKKVKKEVKRATHKSIFPNYFKERPEMCYKDFEVRLY